MTWTSSPKRPSSARTDDYFRLRQEIEEFFYDEANLIDERRFDLWLDCFHDDLVYFMPMRANVKFGQHDERENTRQGVGISWFDEDKWTLTKRVEQILTGVHYAEEPLSRTSHMVTNVQLTSVTPSAAAAEEVRRVVASSSISTASSTRRTSSSADATTTSSRTDDGWKVLRREIVLDQNVLLAKNLTTFF